jgi:hypothetical protein
MRRALLVFAALAAVLPAQNHMITVPCCMFVDSVSQTNVTTVPVGTTVQWNLSGLTFHSVTSGSGSTDPNAGSLFDQALDTVTPTHTFTFTTPGVFPYFCRPHELSSMNGTVIVTVPASAISTGTGCVGSSGVPFTAAPVGLPQIGNVNFAATVTGGPANGQAFLFFSIGLAGTPISVAPGCFLYLDPTTFFQFVSLGISPFGPFPLDAAGGLTFPSPIGPGNGSMGVSIDVQWAAPDPGAPGGVVTSNALSILVGI